jgi:hypothetical protein
MKLMLLLCFAGVLGGVITVFNGYADILYPQAPNGGEQAVSNALTSNIFTNTTLQNYQMWHLPPPKDLTIGRPFRFYFYPINYTNLYSGKLLSVVRFAAWDYPLTYGTNWAQLILPFKEKVGNGWNSTGYLFQRGQMVATPYSIRYERRNNHRR